MRRCVCCTFGSRFHTKGLIGFIQPALLQAASAAHFSSPVFTKLKKNEMCTPKQATTSPYRHTNTQRQTKAILIFERSYASEGKATFRQKRCENENVNSRPLAPKYHRSVSQNLREITKTSYKVKENNLECLLFCF